MKGYKQQKRPDRVQALLDRASRQGYLNLDQVLEVFPEAEDNLAQLENLFTCLSEAGIDVYDHGEENELAQREDRSGENGSHDTTFDLSDIAVGNALSLYLAEIGQVPLLTRNQEARLARQMDRGKDAQRQLERDGHDPQDKATLQYLIVQGSSARQHLIRANTRLVVSVAKRYKELGIPFTDLIQAGNVGLIKAVDKYEVEQGYKLSTYATWWIRQAITRTLADHSRTIRIPVHMTDRIRRLYQAARELEQEMGRQPSPDEIAERMGLEPQSVRWMLQVSRRPLSLEMPVGEEKDREFQDLVEDKRTPSPTESVQRHLLHDSLQKMLDSLSPREARILDLRFGLHDGQTHTLEEVGKKLGVTRERIRQIEKRALGKLRHPRNSRMLRSYLA
jgi:RNA polymerase primary sigma factor